MFAIDQIISIALAIITFLAVLVAFFGHRFWIYYTRPKVKLNFKKKYPFLKEVGTISGKKQPESSIWIRFEVENIGKSTARLCECWLEKLEYYNSNEYKRCDPFDPIILHWVGYPLLSEKITSKEWIENDIKQKSRYLVDIGYIMNKTLELNLQTSIPLIRGNRMTWPKGKYRFTIVIYGDNFKSEPKTIELDILEYKEFKTKEYYP